MVVEILGLLWAGAPPAGGGGEKFALLLRSRRYDYSFLFVLDWLSGLS